MTQAQYNALLEVAENGERFSPKDLNISLRTVQSVARRGWIAIENGKAVVTEKGWQSMAAA